MVVALLAVGAIAVTHPARSAETAVQPRLQNDASSGGDAGDTPEAALLIADARRTWNANLTPTGTDSDWYRLGESDAFCATVDASVGSPGTLTLTGTPRRDAEVSVESMPHRPTRLMLAGPAGNAPHFGVEPPMMSHLLDGGTSSQQPSPGRYTFSFTSVSYAELDPQGDGESPEAGNTAATSAPLPVGCSAGRLDSSTGDAADAYHLDVTDPVEIRLSFALARGDEAEARVISPSGATVATLSSGDAAAVWASEPGRWLVEVTHVTQSLPIVAAPVALDILGAAEFLDTDYLLAADAGPPGDTQPCRPSCLG